MMQRTIYIGLMLVAITFALASGALGFQDVLETPALKSVLAGKTLLNGATRAGTRLVAVGWRGHILYSDDQGKSWSQASVPVSSDLVSVCFPSPQKGWAVGHDGVVLHSSDGGGTWAKQMDGLAAARLIGEYYSKHTPLNPSEGPEMFKLNIKRFVEEGADKPFLDVWFDDDRNGFIVGTFNMIFRTTDGGKSWEPLLDRTENPETLHLYGVRRIGPDLFVSGERGLVMKFDQKSQRFRAQRSLYKGSFFGITGKTGCVIVYGLRGNAFVTRDSGATWKKIETGVRVNLTGAAVTEDGRIVLVSQEGHVLVSAADAMKFNQIKMERPVPASAVAAVDKNTVLLIGLLGLKLQPLN